MGQTSKRILLGHIGAAHGIRGEVVLRSYTAEPLDLRHYGPLTDATGERTFRILALRAAGKGLIARLEGVADRTAAEALRNTELYASREQLPATSAEEWYLADLIGLRAVAPDGAAVGEVIDVPDYGAGDLIEIRPVGGGETLLVPFAKAYVHDVRISEGTLVVELPEMTGEPEPTPEAEPESEE